MARLHMPPVPKPKVARGRHYIREWRTFRRLTQDQMAERLGISRTNYSKIENQKVPYDQYKIEAAAAALNCSIADLLMRNPMDQSAPWALIESLRKADPATQQRIVAVVETLLKTGT